MNKLFIYIPTYNRPDALKEQLSVLLPRIAKLPEKVRILINDNASNKFDLGFNEQYSSFPNIQFRINSGNIGGNANIALGFIFAQPNEFLWILSDNDIVTDIAIDYLLGVLNKEIDFYCFNYEVKSPKKVEHLWEDGCKVPMNWRMGLISDALYNVDSIKSSIDAAFYFHNSSFPHLAVAFSMLKNNGKANFMLLPRDKINAGVLESNESPGDYSLSNVCMPLLLPLLPKKEAKLFSIEWLGSNGVDYYKNKKKHYHLYIQSKVILRYYGGFRADILLWIMFLAYLIDRPVKYLRNKIVKIIKKS